MSASARIREHRIYRIALKVEYNGRSFSGWQTQSSGSVITVQKTLENALACVADHPVRLYCAGRTDAGVHAISQIAHFDTSAERPLKAWVKGVNSNLPPEVRVHWAQLVNEEFHARFSAFARRYCYVIDNREIESAILKGSVTSFRQALDAERMDRAGKFLVGELDFTSYRASNCQSPTPMRNVMHINVTRQGSRLYIDIMANAFLLHMVRNITGVLLEIGAGRKPPEWAAEVLEARDRSKGAVTAPPDGLYLVAVLYPSQFRLPATSPMVPIGVYNLP